MIKVSDSVTTLYYIEDAINDLLELAAQLASVQKNALGVEIGIFEVGVVRNSQLPKVVLNLRPTVVENDTVSN